MAARGFLRSTHFLSYFVRSLPTRVYLMYSTATAYAGDRNENKEGDSRRHKGCFASKRKIQSIRNLVIAKKKRENSSERKSARRRERLGTSKENKNEVTTGKLLLHRCCILAGSTEICYVFFFPFLLLILDNQIPEIK